MPQFPLLPCPSLHVMVLLLSHPLFLIQHEVHLTAGHSGIPRPHCERVEMGGEGDAWDLKTAAKCMKTDSGGRTSDRGSEAGPSYCMLCGV